MIPHDFITEWREHAPWVFGAQVEQDLVISRAVVEIFNQPDLKKKLAFRGGTALYKLFVKPPLRYSEDIDLAQTVAEPIGSTLDLIRGTLDGWLGEPKRKLKEGRIILSYRFNSEDTPPRPLRLKIEINSREHFSVFPLDERELEVRSRWFSGSAQVTTYRFEELMGTKMRALYQRKKGRDLFDLAIALRELDIAPGDLVDAFQRYLAEEGLKVSRAEYEANMVAKLEDRNFTQDVVPLLAPDVTWDAKAAYAVVHEKLVTRLPGEPWKGLSPAESGQ